MDLDMGYGCAGVVVQDVGLLEESRADDGYLSVWDGGCGERVSAHGRVISIYRLHEDEASTRIHCS
jgi:hypothetical protein